MADHGAGRPGRLADLHPRFGSLPFDRLFEPAIYYAEHGYLVSPIISHYWAGATQELRRLR